MKRITDVTENTAHNIPSLHLDESSNQLTAELWSPSVGKITIKRKQNINVEMSRFMLISSDAAYLCRWADHE